MDVAKEAATGGDGAQPGQAPLNTLRHAQALPPVSAVNPPLPGVDTRSTRPAGSTSRPNP